MGSSLTTLLGLVEDQIDSGTTSANTEPTNTLLVSYINLAIRKIAREMMPREVYTASPATASSASGQNTVTIPATILVPNEVYYGNSSGVYSQLFQTTLKQLIDIEGSNNYFDSTNVGTPTVYAIEGTSIIFNKYADYTGSNNVKVFGITIPTTLSIDSASTTTELATDYDLLIAYESARFLYQKEKDTAQLATFSQLANDERKRLLYALNTNNAAEIMLDPRYFKEAGRIGVSNPSFLFGQ